MMPELPGDEFFVGHAERLPPRLARSTRGTALWLILGALLIGAWIASGHGPFTAGTFEFGVVRSFEGTLVEEPAPALRVMRPGRLDGLPVPLVSRYLLVAFGKRGARELVAGRDGQRATVTGSLVHREGRTMIEVETVLTMPTSEPPAPPTPAVSLGRMTLTGQIVDSKCWLGVMVPADTTTHRACAVRCLSGGIPPVFRVRADDGSELALLLTAADGSLPGAEILPMVAEPLTVTGEVVRQDDLLVLKADPSDFVSAR
jgi:hypothetical protein